MVPAHQYQHARPFSRLVFAATFLLLPALAQTAPGLFFSDLTSGARTGNTDTTHGSGNGAYDLGAYESTGAFLPRPTGLTIQRQ